MPSLTETMAAIERRMGFPHSRLKQVSRRLQDAEILPLGAPGASPIVNLDNVLDLVIAIAADTTLRQSAAAVATYGNLSPGGADVSGAPANVPRNAKQVLRSLAAMAIDGDPLAELTIEVVATWPEVTFIWADGRTDRFRETGALASHWGADRQRRATTIPGRAFSATFKELFA